MLRHGELRIYDPMWLDDIKWSEHMLVIVAPRLPRVQSVQPQPLAHSLLQRQLLHKDTDSNEERHMTCIEMLLSQTPGHCLPYLSHLLSFPLTHSTHRTLCIPIQLKLFKRFFSNVVFSRRIECSLPKMQGHSQPDEWPSFVILMVS